MQWLALELAVTATSNGTKLDINGKSNNNNKHSGGNNNNYGRVGERPCGRACGGRACNAAGGRASGRACRRASAALAYGVREQMHHNAGIHALGIKGRHHKLHL